MSLEDRIKEKFLTDTQEILEAHLEDVDGMFRFHEDGKTEILDDYREISPINQTMLFLIAERYKKEAGLTENDTVSNKDLYQMFPDKSDSTVRNYVMNLRREGLCRDSDDGIRFVVERLPDAIERIEENRK